MTFQDVNHSKKQQEQNQAVNAQDQQQTEPQVPAVELAVFNLDSVTHVVDHQIIANQVQNFLMVCGQTSLKNVQAHAQVTTVANIYALTGSVLDLLLYATVPQTGAAAVQRNALLAANLIGLFAEPASEAHARMALRPMLGLMAECLYPENGKIKAADIRRLELHLNARMAGDLELFLKETQGKLSALLSSASQLGSTILQSLVATAPPQAVTVGAGGASAEKRDPQLQFTNWASPLIDLLSQDAEANIEPKIDAPASHLQQAVTDALATITTAIQEQANAGTQYSLAWLIQETLKAIQNNENKGNASVPINQTGEYERHTEGDILEFVTLQADALNAPPCSGAESGSDNSISYSIGAERISHNDFALPKIGLVFSRLYNSQMHELDGSSMGARWMMPFSNSIIRHDKGYVFIDGKGRKIQLPHSIVQQGYEVPYEGTRVIPLENGRLSLNFGSAWAYDFESFNGGESYQLVLEQNEESKESVELKYAVLNGQAYLQTVDFQLKKFQHTLKFAYNDQGKMIAIFVDDVATPLARYSYDRSGNLIEAIDENGHAHQYQYNAHHQLTRYTDRTGRGQNIRYDSTLPTAKAIEEWADDGSYKTTLKWHPRLRQVAVYDAYHVPTYYYFDLDGFTYRIRLADGREKWYSRDQQKRITREIDFTGRETQQYYNEAGQLDKIVQPNSGVIRFAYDKKGNLTEVKDPEGYIWKREYNADGLMSKEINPLGHKTEYKYDAEGQLIEVIDAKGGSKKIQYNDLGQMIAYTDCSGKESAWQYDEEGTLQQQLGADQQGVQYLYSTQGIDKGQLKTIVYPDGQKEHFEHDQEGRLQKHIDTAGKVTTYKYNAVGLLQQRLDANQDQIAYTWDLQGRIQKLINQNHAEYLFDYNQYGQLVREQDFEGEEKHYRYCEDGYLHQIRQPNVITQFDYYADGQIKAKHYTHIETRHTQTEEFAYNLNGQLSRASNAISQNDFYRNALGQLVREHQHYKLPDLTPMTAVLRYDYDELGNLIKTIRPDGQEVSHLTYGSGHVYGVALNKQDMVGFKRDDLHHETERYLANGLIQQNQYNELGLLTAQIIQPEQETIDRLSHHAQRQYSYDKNYLLTQVQDSRFGQLNYQYDAIGRLVKSQNAHTTESFSFDPAGNLIDTRASQGRDVKNNLLKEYQGKRYKYDAQGNVIETQQGSKVLKLKWDNLNRLIQSDHNGQITSYGYDVFGRRLFKKTDKHLTLFGWAGDLMIWESRQDQEAQNSYTKHYVYEPNSFVPLLQAGYAGFIKLIETPNYERFKTEAYSIQKDPVWRTDTRRYRAELERIAFYQCDQIGTPQALSNERGECIWEIALKTWGETQEINAQNPENPLEQSDIRFQGQYYDEETGLHYNRYRYYEPFSARYLSKDPIGLEGGINSRTYIADPIQWVDQLGLTPLNAAGAILGGIAGGVGGYTTGGWKGVPIGVGTGAVVGAVNPWASNAVGAAAGAGAASIAGQGVGLATKNKNVTNVCNYDAGAVLGAMAGGAVGGAVSKLAIKKAPYIRVDMINKPLGTSGINRTPGKLSGALLDGKITGTGELLGTGKITFPSCNK
ncbi:RHS repeat-associated core domain-containing protein [Acinetobacter shaoyimingii]|uniref:RHS repeat protein n=1 Tax=Acinetobacter shaoyimingii TaxID=2715164 RepID=A0A6G8RVR5_9GAMM|nr:RHS repeat-associated core domain-containing protein [Acinetobacter shaoyimingii]QIO05888.1 RHS repeat protein [Acinetobacter shaoyimingii]